MRLTLLAILLLTGCSGAQTKQRADGTYALECSNRKACLDRADLLCKSEGYVVVGGKSNKRKYGVPGNEKMIGKDEIYVRCNKDRPLDTPDLQAGTWRLPRDNGDPGQASTAPSVKPFGATCRPGETLRCVGPGACNGGQACLADGSGFGPCDCGPAAAEGTSPSAAPSANP